MKIILAVALLLFVPQTKNKEAMCLLADDGKARLEINLAGGVFTLKEGCQGWQLSGVATVTSRSCLWTIEAEDENIWMVGVINRCDKRATAIVVHKPNNEVLFSLKDSDWSDNKCMCN